VVVCHCTWCQRRTGSVFGVGAYFPREKVEVRGEHHSFDRAAPQGRAILNRFCPECGCNVFWFGDLFPDLVGVAVGCFADATFPEPDRAVWAQHAHPWVSLAPEVSQFTQMAPRPPGT